MMDNWDITRFNVRIPKEQMDWDKIRKAKIHCEKCEFFDWRTGGCDKGLLAGETCKETQLVLI